MAAGSGAKTFPGDKGSTDETGEQGSGGNDGSGGLEEVVPGEAGFPGDTGFKDEKGEQGSGGKDGRGGLEVVVGSGGKGFPGDKGFTDETGESGFKEKCSADEQDVKGDSQREKERWADISDEVGNGLWRPPEATPEFDEATWTPVKRCKQRGHRKQQHGVFSGVGFEVAPCGC